MIRYLACVTALALLTWQAPLARAASIAPQPAPMPDNGAAMSETTKYADIEAIIAAGKKNGFESSVELAPGDWPVVLKMTKLGKTESGHGVLQKKWDEKDTIDLTFTQTANGIKLQSVKRDVLVKPPIGDWISQPTEGVPAWILAPKAVSG